jgi:hypothetical protein
VNLENFRVRAWCCDYKQTEYEMKYDTPFTLKLQVHAFRDTTFYYYHPSLHSILGGKILDVMLFTGQYDNTAWNELSVDNQNFWTEFGLGAYPKFWKGIPIFEADMIHLASQQIPKDPERRKWYIKTVEWNEDTCGFNIRPVKPNSKGYRVLGNKYQGLIYE